MISIVAGQGCSSAATVRTRIRIRIQNAKFETWQSTLKRYPKTLLGSDEKRRVYYDERADEIVFDRSVAAFHAILFYYQSPGILTRPPSLTMAEFLDECSFFELGVEDIERMKEVENYDEGDNESLQHNENCEDSDETLQLLKDASTNLKASLEQNQNCMKFCRARLWEFFEEPSSSKIASFFAIFSFALIAASVGLACILTVPEIQNSRNPDLFKDPWALIELALNGCFALEYLLRLMVTPDYTKFLISPMNCIDFLAFFPYFVVLSIDPTKLSSLSFLRMLRMIRVLRLLRLSKQSKRIATVINMIKQLIKDIFTFVLCYVIVGTVFGSLIYYLEIGTPGTPFTSIPQSMWWAFQSVIPLGYGDIVPSGLKGKLVGGSVLIIGAVTLTVPLLHLSGKYLTEFAGDLGLQIGRDFKSEANKKNKQNSFLNKPESRHGKIHKQKSYVLKVK